MKNISLLKAWLELLRFPNLFTVPGDPILGTMLFIVCAPWDTIYYKKMLAAVVSSLFIYSTGLILNDIADLEEDSKRRPMRPLPSGRISRLTAFFTTITLILLAISLGFFVSAKAGIITFFLLSLVVFYNFYSRTIRLLGITNMALCRGFNIILGPIYVFGSVNRNVLAAAVGIFIYIFSVSYIALEETNSEQNAFWRYRYLPAGSGFLWGVIVFGSLVVSAGIFNKFVVALFVLFMLFLATKAAFVKDTPSVVGIYLTGLIPIQSAFCFATQHELGMLLGAFLLLLWLCAILASKKFYSS